MEYLGDILKLVKKKIKEQGAYDRDAYREIVDESILFFTERGKLTDEDNLELIQEELMSMYETVQDEFVYQEKTSFKTK